MALLAWRLRRAGFATLTITYPSRKLPLDQIAHFLHARISPITARSARVHFVGHSMGGLVIRHYLYAYPTPNLGRIVMLGTPNQGSKWADIFKDFLLFRWLYGPAGQQLTTTTSHPDIKDTQVGIIAGEKSHIPFSSRVLGGKNDGQVATASTVLANMRDYAVVPCSHTFLTFSKSVAQKTITFLNTGAFNT